MGECEAILEGTLHKKRCMNAVHLPFLSLFQSYFLYFFSIFVLCFYLFVTFLKSAKRPQKALYFLMLKVNRSLLQSVPTALGDRGDSGQGPEELPITARGQG